MLRFFWSHIIKLLVQSYFYSRRFGLTAFRIGISCRDISSPVTLQMYVNVPRVALKLEDHSLSGRSGKDASTTSKDAKRWGCIQTSLKRGGVRQLKTSCSRPYIGRFNPCKSGAPWCTGQPFFVPHLRQAFSLFQNNKTIVYRLSKFNSWTYGWEPLWDRWPDCQRQRICERDFRRDAQRVCLWILKVSEESLGWDDTPRQTSHEHFSSIWLNNKTYNCFLYSRICHFLFDHESVPEIICEPLSYKRRDSQI